MTWLTIECRPLRRAPLVTVGHLGREREAVEGLPGVGTRPGDGQQVGGRMRPGGRPDLPGAAQVEAPMAPNCADSLKRGNATVVINVSFPRLPFNSTKGP